MSSEVNRTVAQEVSDAISECLFKAKGTELWDDAEEEDTDV